MENRFTDVITGNQLMWYYNDNISLNIMMNIVPFIQVRILYHKLRNSFSAGIIVNTIDPEYYINHHGQKVMIKKRIYGSDGTEYYTWAINKPWEKIICDPG